MANKSVIINVTIDEAIRTAYVTYSTGTEKTYPTDSLPKTVSKWLAENEQVSEQAEQEAAQIEQEAEQSAGLPVIDTSTGETVSTDGEELIREIMEEGSEPEAVEAVGAVEELVEAAEKELMNTVEGAAEDSPECTEPVRRPAEHRPVKPSTGLIYDILDGIETACLMLGRITLLIMAYLIGGAAVAVRTGIQAADWLVPRTDALIETARPAVISALESAGVAWDNTKIWAAEAVWYMMILSGLAG